MLVQVPTAHGKSDMGIYRSFGARVLKIISETCGAGSLTEKASGKALPLTDDEKAAFQALHDAQIAKGKSKH